MTSVRPNSRKRLPSSSPRKRQPPSATEDGLPAQGLAPDQEGEDRRAAPDVPDSVELEQLRARLAVLEMERGELERQLARAHRDLEPTQQRAADSACWVDDSLPEIESESHAHPTADAESARSAEPALTTAPVPPMLEPEPGRDQPTITPPVIPVVRQELPPFAPLAPPEEPPPDFSAEEEALSSSDLLPQRPQSPEPDPGRFGRLFRRGG